MKAIYFAKPAVAMMALIASHQSMATEAEVPEYVQVKSINAAGTGCPLGTIQKNISDDKKAFTMTFSEYFAEIYDGSFPGDSRRNCNLTIDLDFPEGWTYSLVSFDYRGYVFLDDQVEATAKAAYYFQSESEGVEFQSQITGFADEDYHFRDELGIDSVVWSPGCSGARRPLNLQTQIRVNNEENAGGEGFITVDSIDGEFTQKYGLVWRRCVDGPSEPSIPDWAFRPDYDGQFPLAPADLTIKDMTYNGSGCPIGTIANTISDDKKAFTLLFDSFIAEAGPGISLRDSRKNCQVTMDLDYPDGWTFALATFDYRGYMFLDDDVEARQSANYYFQGEAANITRADTVKGFADEDYHFRDVIPVDALMWAPCDKKRALNVNTSINVNNRKARSNSGLITVDSKDGQFAAYHALVWRKCN